MIALLLLAGGVALRLAAGPLSLDPLKPYFAEALSRSFNNAEVAFDSVLLTWDGEAGALDIRLENVDISNIGQSAIAGKDRAGFAAHFGSVGLGLSRIALLGLRIEPVHLVLHQPELMVEWSAPALNRWAVERLRVSYMGPPIPGPIRLAVAGDERDEPVASAGPLVEVIRSLLGAPIAGQRLGQLERIEVTSADIRMVERTSGVEWRLPKARLEFTRNWQGIFFSADLTLVAGGRTSRLKVSTELATDRDGSGISGARTVIVELDGLNPAEMARDVNLQSVFESIDVPVYGSLRAEITPEGDLSRLFMDMGAGAGKFWAPALYPEPLEIDEARLVARYEVAERRLYIESLRARKGSTEVTADGLVEFTDEIKRPILKVHATLTNMNFDDVVAYWPARLSPNSRRWIKDNISAGQVIEARFDIAMEPHMWGMRPVPASALRIDFEVADVSVNYLRPMPLAIHAFATGTFTSDAMNIGISSAEIDGIPMRDSNVFIDKAGYRGKQRGTVTAQMEGSVADFMRLIDYEPLQLVSKYNIPADKVSGQAFVVSAIKFPLRAGITVDDVEIKVEADITDGAMPSLMEDGGLTDAALRMNIDKRGLSANGRILLKDTPFHIYWTETFTPALEKDALGDDVMTSHYELTGNLNDVQLAKFGVPMLGTLSGEVHTHINIEGRAGTPVRGTGEADLFAVAVDDEMMGWKKPANAAGTATFELAWSEQDLVVSSLVIAAPGIEAEASFVFDRVSGDMKAAQVPIFKTEGYDLSLMSTLKKGGVYDVVIDATRFDARIYMEDLLVAEGGDTPPMLLSLRAKEAIALNGVTLLDVTLEAENTGNFWASAEINAEMAAGGSLSVMMGPTEMRGARTATLISSDAGQAARAVGLFVNGTGGQLYGTAELQAKGEKDRLSGLIQISDFRVVNSSVLVGALTERFGQDIDSYLDEQGMDFARFYLPFKIEDGVIDISDARANGPSIGFTLQGQVNRKAGAINLSGAIIPAYALNSLVGNIPVVGPLLTGGDGGGLFALTYRIVGSVEDPKVTLNPLSALAPGLLRKIFEGPKGTVDPNQPEDEEPGEEDMESEDAVAGDGASGGGVRRKH